MRFILSILLGCISCLQSDSKVSLSLVDFNVFCNKLLFPYIDTELENLEIKGPISLDYDPLFFHLKIQNFKLLKKDIDWSQVQISSGTNHHLINFQVRGIKQLDFQFDYIGTQPLKLSGVGNATMKNLQLNFVFNFTNNQSLNSGFQVQIQNYDGDYGEFQINTGISIIDGIINQIASYFKTRIQDIINYTFLSLNVQLAQISSQNQIQLSNQNIQFKVTKGPIIVNQNYFEFSLFSNISNQQKLDSYYQEQVFKLMNRTQYNEMTQFILGNNVLNQGIKALTRAFKLNHLINNSILPESSPVKLNTSDISLIFPKINDKYQKNLGIYVKIENKDNNPTLLVRDSQILAIIGLNLGFYVDKDSSNYPQQNLDQCTQCELMANLDSQVFLRVNIKTQENQDLKVSLQNIQIFNTQVSDQTFEIDQNNLQKILNNAIDAYIPTIRSFLKTPIQNPIIGQYGVKNMNLTFDNSLDLKISFIE